MSELVHLDVADHIATITLDSPANRNALSRQLVTELLGHLDQVATDEQLRAVLLRATGKAFCAGADLSEALTVGVEAGTASMVELQRRLALLPQPVVAVVEAPVRAGGLGLLGAADIVLAADHITFALTEVRLALAPAAISLTLLPRFTDRAAAELFLTGRTFTATEAAGIGLITHAVPATELEHRVSELVDQLRAGYPQGLRETKKLLTADILDRIDRLGDQVAKRSAELFASDEAKSAMEAFFGR